MGALARALNSALALLPERKTTVGGQIPTWEAGHTQMPRQSFERYAQDGYNANEIVYAAVEELATSAAEPRLRAMRKGGSGADPEELADHPVLDLFERPNPFLSRFQLIATLIMYRAVAGNAYLEIGRSAAGKAVELWLLRPDRMFVIPDPQTHIGGWEYRLGDQTFRLNAEDVVQTRTRHPLDDYYGLPPLAVCAPRVDTDALMRAFTLSFFRNAGVPAGLLNITKTVTAAEKHLIQDRHRAQIGGPTGWHSLLVLDNTEASYTPMGLPLGSGGIVLPELDEISEARIAMAFGVPLELLGARLGMVHGNRSTTLAARGTFWDETLVPLYQELAADLSRGLVPEYADTPDAFDFLEFDLSTVKALQEDDDAKHTRVREDVKAGLLSVQEARTIIGHEPEYEQDAILMLGPHVQPISEAAARQLAEAPPALAAPAAPPVPGMVPAASNGNGTGQKSRGTADLAALARLAAGTE